MRCCGGQFDSQAVPGHVVAGTGDMVGLVDDHHVPARVHHRPEPGRVVRLDLFGSPPGALTQRLDGIQPADHPVEGPPRIHARVNRHTLWADTDKVLTETVGHLGHPLELHALGRNDHRAPDAAAGPHLGEDRSGGDGLAQPDLVAYREAHGVHPKGALQGGQLVRKQSHARSGDYERLALGGQAQCPGRRRPPGHLRLRPLPDPEVDHLVGGDPQATLRRGNDDLVYTATPQLVAAQHLHRLARRGQPRPASLGHEPYTARRSALR